MANPRWIRRQSSSAILVSSQPIIHRLESTFARASRECREYAGAMRRKFAGTIASIEVEPDREAEKERRGRLLRIGATRFEMKPALGGPSLALPLRVNVGTFSILEDHRNRSGSLDGEEVKVVKLRYLRRFRMFLHGRSHGETTRERWRFLPVNDSSNDE